MAEEVKEDRTKFRGFASMSPERRAEIARKGGVSAHVKGTAHQWTVEEAVIMGRKGGKSRWERDEKPSK